MLVVREYPKNYPFCILTHFLPQLFNIFTQIYLPYLWHFATLTSHLLPSPSPSPLTFNFHLHLSSSQLIFTFYLLPPHAQSFHLLPGVDLQCDSEGEHPAWLTDERGLVPPGHRGVRTHLRSQGEVLPSQIFLSKYYNTFNKKVFFSKVLTPVLCVCVFSFSATETWQRLVSVESPCQVDRGSGWANIHNHNHIFIQRELVSQRQHLRF